MCFSPTASFVAAGLTGALGAYGLSLTRHPNELPMAAMPLLFGVQQALEGLLWLNLPSANGALNSILIWSFLFFAHVLWPLYAPSAALALEGPGPRRRIMHACLAAGAMLSAYLLFGLLSRSPDARLAHEHIVYSTGEPYPRIAAILYLAVICLPLLASSRRGVSVMGAIILGGAVVTHAFYDAGFQSIWCYFAALASLVLAWDFHRRRQIASAHPA